MQKLSGALQAAEARNRDQAALLLAAESRERQAATDAEAARHAIEDARAEIAKLISEGNTSKEDMQATISSLQQVHQDASNAQAVAEQSLRMKSEEISQLHSLLQGLCDIDHIAPHLPPVYMPLQRKRSMLVSRRLLDQDDKLCCVAQA